MRTVLAIAWYYPRVARANCILLNYEPNKATSWQDTIFWNRKHFEIQATYTKHIPTIELLFWFDGVDWENFVHFVVAA